MSINMSPSSTGPSLPVTVELSWATASLVSIALGLALSSDERPETAPSVGCTGRVLAPSPGESVG